MSDKSRQMTPEEAAEFTEQVFNKAREGDAAMMAALLTKGLPPNLRNHKGDTLLMLAAYHGHVDTVKVLLTRPIRKPAMTTARARLPAPPSRVTWRWSQRWLKVAHRLKVRPSMAVPR
jgi:ankyrin repeat protein